MYNSDEFHKRTFPIFSPLDLVPYFGKTNESYIEYPALDNAFMNFDIVLSFRPESTDGLVLYNGQYSSRIGDFMCFGLNRQRPEFKFDVGSGVVTITGDQPLELFKWHTIHLKKKDDNGMLSFIANSTFIAYPTTFSFYHNLSFPSSLVIKCHEVVKTHKNCK